MSLDLQQKNIINPFTEDLIGEQYLQIKRNKFVQDVIHEAHTNLLLTVTSGQKLDISPQEISSLLGDGYPHREITITTDDLVVYTALYPQNCTVVTDSEGITKLEPLGQADSVAKLKELVTKLDTAGILDLYSTNSSPASINNGVITTGAETAHLRLIAISPNHSNEYLNLIRKTVGSTDAVNSTIAEEVVMSSIVNSYISSDNNVDIYDWRKNCNPDTDTDKVYYNPIDEKFYFTKRTMSSERGQYDIHINNLLARDVDEDAPPHPGPQPILQMNINNPNQAMADYQREMAAWMLADAEYRMHQAQRALEPTPIRDAVRNGLTEILKLSGRFSRNNLNNLLEGADTPNKKYEFVSHIDLRPGSRWIYVVKVSKRYIDLLEEENNLVVSYDEFELTPLQKAKLLLDKKVNKTTLRKVFEAEDLIRFLPPVSRLLKDYSEIISDEDIPAKVLNGIRMGSESIKISSFIDYLSICFVYNKRMLDDRNVIEFSFSEKFNLEYLTVDGYLFSRGIGNKKFYSLPESEEEVPAKILNAFSQATPTTFSIIARSAEIFNETRVRESSDRKSWISFMIENLYPKIDDSAISIRKAAARSDAAKRRARRGKLFTKISSLKKEGDDIRNELERASKKDVDDNGRAMYRVGSMLSGLDCNTAQAAALNNALKLWQAFSGKTRWRSVVRLAILGLRDEIIKDSVLKAYASKAIQADDNPDLVIREIERSINNQIFCGLDVLGNVIETSFLDPKDMNPSKTAGKSVTLGESLKIELKLPRGMGSMGKKSDVYEKMIKEILTGFIKSLVAGIVKDILEAALGCAPAGDNSESLNATIKNINYGYVDINTYLDDVDIVEVAIESGLLQTTRETVNGEEVVTQAPPTNEQIKKLLTDISYMSTPGELDVLLLGDGELLLYNLLLETLSDGTITYPFTRVKESGGRERTLNRTIDPSVYRNLELTQESLQEFLLALGDAMNEENAGRIAQFTFNPMEAYCDTKDPMGLEDFGLGISVEQLDAQYSAIAQDKINKINAMCDWLKELEEIKRKLQELIDNLPIMDYYEDMLRLIANISNGLMEGLASLWASLWGEEAEHAVDAIFNVYSTRFGQDMFNSLYLMLSKRMTAQAKTFLMRSESQPRGNDETEREIENIKNEIIADLRSHLPRQMHNDFYLAILESEQENLDGFYYYSPTSKDTDLNRNLPLPYLLSHTEEPWYWYDYDIDVPRGQRRAQYALRTGPKDIRQRLMEVSPNDDKKIYFKGLGNAYSAAIKEKTKIVGLPLNLRNYPSKATCQLHIENPASGSIYITTEIITDEGEKKLVPLATYEPSTMDTESESNINYHSIISSIGPKSKGGPISPNLFLRESDINSGQMPPRNNEEIAHIINQIFLGLLGRGGGINLGGGGIGHFNGTDSISVGNYKERIENHLDESYTQERGRSQMKLYLRVINKNPFIVNQDKCVTQEEVYIASSLATVIQSRLRSFFMNVLPLARIYPNWGGLGTKKLIIDYLQKKIILDLEKQGIINQVYDSLDIYQKVYIDNPDNLELASVDMSLPPKQIVSIIIEKTYSSILKNITEIDYFRGLDDSPYASTITNQRYKRTLSDLFIFMRRRISATPEGEEALGLSSYTFESGSRVVRSPGERPPIPEDFRPDGLRAQRLLSKQVDWFINYREYRRYLGTDRQPPNQRPELPMRPLSPSEDPNRVFWSDAERDIKEQEYETALQEYEEAMRLVTEWLEENQNGHPRYMNEALRMINNKLLDENNEITELGMIYGAYYLPISLLYALYIISYDHLVATTINFRSGYMRTLIEKYAADDTFLSSVKGITVNQFSKNVEGMPIAIQVLRKYRADRRDDYVLRKWITKYYSKEEIRERIELLSIQTATGGKFNEFLKLLRFELQQEAQERIIKHEGGFIAMGRSFSMYGDEIALSFLDSLIAGTLSPLIDMNPNNFPSSESFVTATHLDPLGHEILIRKYEEFLRGQEGALKDFLDIAPLPNHSRSADTYETLLDNYDFARPHEDHNAEKWINANVVLLSATLTVQLEKTMLNRQEKLAEKIELEDLLKT